MEKDSKSKKPKWDGKSRVSNDTYRKRWNEIFGKDKNIGVVRTEASFVSQDYGEDKTYENEKPKMDNDASD
tara:strand:+ start:1471 stop:1683 length:213 start_codon:yes stop_codon:yes gene_type:complete